jgi:hypothetical protein
LNLNKYAPKIITYNMPNNCISDQITLDMTSFSLVNDKIYFSTHKNIYSYDPIKKSKNEFSFEYGNIKDFIIDNNNVFVLSNERKLYRNNKYVSEGISFVIHNNNLFILFEKSKNLNLRICDKENLNVITERLYDIFCSIQFPTTFI